MKTWQNDWETFVSSVASDFDQGMTNEEVSEKYCDQPVEWVGELSKISYEEEPSASLKMLPVEVQLSDGRFGTVDYLGVVIAEGNAQQWEQVKPGMAIAFRTSIRKGNGPFPGIEWADLGDLKGYISIGTRETALVSIQ